MVSFFFGNLAHAIDEGERAAEIRETEYTVEVVFVRNVPEWDFRPAGIKGGAFEEFGHDYDDTHV